MVFFLLLAAGLWALGWYLGTPRSARWIMIGLVYVAILAVAVVFPEGNPLRTAIGGTTAEWLTVGALAGAAWVYSEGLKRLRARVRPENRPVEPPKVTVADQLRRQARHITLREIGGPGQKRLGAAKVLVVGAGGLGSPALQYLAAAGVGTVGVIDDDVVEATNLQRQVIHTDGRIGMPKVFSAEMAMKAQNPAVEVRPYNRRLEPAIAETLFADYDLILDGTDNFETRYLVNRAAFATGKPLIAAALSQWEGQISVYAPRDGTPCYQCIFPEAPAPGLAPSCAEAGVLGPLPGVVGAMMAVEAVKEITGAGESLRGRMLIYDALHADARVIRLKKRPGCAVCGG
jgi:molybdopterin/thiamine biosynthesis adenylyltransferase